MLLFVAATAFDINEGVALTPLMVLYLLFFVTAAGVVVIAVDPGDPDVMNRPPRDPKLPITNRAAVTLWVLYAATLFVAALIPLVAGPDDPSTDAPSASLTMTFVVMGLGTVFNALTNRRDPASGLDAADPEGARDLARPGGDDRARDRAARSPERAAHDLAHRPGVGRCFGLAALLPLVIETSKWIRRRRAPAPTPLDAQQALAPQRAVPAARGEDQLPRAICDVRPKKKAGEGIRTLGPALTSARALTS